MTKVIAVGRPDSGPLTADYVPPKGAGALSKAELLPELVAQRLSAVDDEVNLPMPLKDSPPVEWPERPDKWGANLFSNEITFVAYARRKRHGR
jgi:hypothetical protein